MVTKLSDKSKWEHWHFDISGVWICWTYLFRVADIPFPSISRISRSFELRPIRGTGKASSSSQCQRGAPSGDVARASEWRRKICWRLWTYLCLLLYILLYYIHNNIICYSILYIWYSILYTWYSIIHTLHIYIYIHTYYSMHIYIYIEHTVWFQTGVIFQPVWHDHDWIRSCPVVSCLEYFLCRVTLGKKAIQLT